MFGRLFTIRGCGNGEGWPKMTRNLKVCLVAGSALSAVMLMGPNGYAQTAASPGPGATSSVSTLGEVVVTARGRAEQLLSVPISDTAFSAKQIASAHIREVGDFINLTPNITIVQAQDAGYSAITIRGITQVRNSESPVAVVVDGVQQVNSNQFTQELFDLQSIEVLRGPQGALYGRDAEGGAILINTKQPTNTVEGHVEVGGGNGGEFNTQGVISGPIIKDQLYGRLSISYVDRAGYFDNAYLNKKEDPFENVSVQGLLKWVPTSKFEADLKVAYSDTNGGALNYHFQGASVLPNGNIATAVSAGQPGVYVTPGQTYIPLNFSGPFNANQVSDTFNSRDIGVDHRTLADVSLKLSYDLGFGTLRSVTAWNHVQEFYDGDGYPYANTNTIQDEYGEFGYADLVDATATQFLDVDAKSEEIRLTSPNDQRFRWMIGAYYLSSQEYLSTTTGFNNGLGILQVKRAPAPAGTINPTLSFLGDEDNNTSVAGFASVDYDLTPQLQLSGAFRYDETFATQFVSPYNTTGTPGVENKATFSQGQPKVTLTYKLWPTLSFYGSWGIGFRSGEFNPNGVSQIEAAAGQPGVTDKVPQETAKTGEVGFKSSWLNNRVSVSGDVYETQVENQQYFLFLGAVAAQVLVPIQQVQLYGGELEARAVIAPGLQAFGGLGITQSRIDKYVLDPANVGNQAPYVPDMTFNAGAEYRTPITNGLVFVTRADYRLLGKQYWDTANDTARNAVNLVGLSVGLEDAKGKWTASIKADNLLNVKYNAEFVSGGYVEPADPMIIRGVLRVNF
jgi:iron complex outermembrane receptor protein